DAHRQVDEFVRAVAHGRHDDHNLVALLEASLDTPGNVEDALGVGHRCAAVLLDNQHGKSVPRRRRSGEGSFRHGYAGAGYGFDTSAHSWSALAQAGPAYGGGRLNARRRTQWRRN